MKIFFLTLLIVMLSPKKLHVQEIDVLPKKEFTLREALLNPDPWVDSIINTLSLEEKIGQLFMIAAYSNRDEKHLKDLEEEVTKNKVGGLIFFQGTPYKQAVMTNHLQSLSKVPLLISIDGEWGLSMRLDSTPLFPRQLTLGAIRDDKLIYEMGREIARQCQRIGIHVNLAPVIDVNNNPNNPVINDRSFGENKYNVALKGLAYMEGMQDNGIMANAKHFPGHGDTDKDSHKTLPVITHSKERLKDIEMYPFEILFNNGLKSVMAAHINIPSLDSTLELAASLSPKITTDLLKKEMGFQGLVFSDALNMKGVSNFYKSGELEVRTFMAGNDVLLFSEDVGKGIDAILKAVKKGDIKESDIDVSVKKILRGKFEAGLYNYQPIPLYNLTNDLNTPNAEVIIRKLYERSLTVVTNREFLIPFIRLDTLKIASVAIGAQKQNKFQEMLGNYAPVKHFQIAKDASNNKFEKLAEDLKGYNTVIIGLHDMSRFSAKGFGVTEQTKEFIRRLHPQTKVVLSVFGNPYSLKYFEDLDWLLCAYEDNEFSQSYAAQAIFGGIKAQGQLPVSPSEDIKYGRGVFTMDRIRMKYTIPEELGIKREDLWEMDKIAMDAIKDKAMPGAQAMVVVDGHVIYQKSYGHHTYDSLKPVENTDLYDIASLTKVAATTISLMRLEEEGRVKVSHKMGDYLPFADPAFRKLKIRDVLLHQAGLQAWIPFYEKTISPGIYEFFYCRTPDDCFAVPVANDLFLREDYSDTIWNTIGASKLDYKQGYKYSDLGFYLFKNMVENVTSTSFSNFNESNFYKPLGLATMTFNPLEKFPIERIPPTELDKNFRKQLVHGTVHDQGAAMLGGVSGHAGLFSNANDLAILFQMLMNNGEYGGMKYFDEATIKEFTSRQSRISRRGLGFDKPETDKTKDGPTAKSASASTFGHSGFTGTGTWADPENNLIFVFLSNRIHPSADNRKLITNNVRTKMHEVAYQALQKKNYQPDHLFSAGNR